MKPRFIIIDGKRYLWAELVARRKAQLEAARKAEQPTLFKLIDDTRPKKAATPVDRYREPSLFEL